MYNNKQREKKSRNELTNSFEERGCRESHALEDWIDAEREPAKPESIELLQDGVGRSQTVLNSL